MLASAAFVCFGQLFWKIGSSNNMLFVIGLGFILYGCGAILMIQAYKYGSVSVLQPLLSVSYVLSSILGVIVLAEVLTPLKVIAILFIMTGAIIIGGSEK